jgi:hypothetical protein
MRWLTARRAAADIGFFERAGPGAASAGGAACHAEGVLSRSAGNILSSAVISARSSWTR